MPAALLPDERLLAAAFATQLGPIETWFDGTFGLRPAGDRRGIRLESALIHDVGELRAPERTLIVAAVAAAFSSCQDGVRARLTGARTLRGARLADVDLLELRVDDGPWVPAGEIRAA
jgi:hypothetical protein